MDNKTKVEVKFFWESNQKFDKQILLSFFVSHYKQDNGLLQVKNLKMIIK